MRSAAVAFLLTLLTACGGDKAPAAGDGKAAADAKPAGADPAAAESGEIAKADDEGEPFGDGHAPPTNQAPAEDDGEGEGSGGKAGADAKADDTGADPKAEADAADPAEGDEAGGSGGDDAKAAADPKTLLTEVKSKKTKDDRALAALGEAEAAGAEAKDLAKAANARGLALHATPDRAKTFFQWALDKDPKAADPAFNLAKQAAVLGEVDETKKWLTETKNRGGKKLIAQIEYDPMWEIVKDDPDVKALLQK
jgi:hypothetical protein